MKIEIRPAVLEDIPRIVELLSEMEPAASVFLGEGGTLDFLTDFMTDNRGRGFVAEDQDADNILVGCVFVTDELQVLHSFGVSSTYRYRGIGTRLVNEIILDYQRRTKNTRIEAIVSIDYETGLGFWRKFGMLEGSVRHWMITFYQELGNQD